MEAGSKAIPNHTVLAGIQCVLDTFLNPIAFLGRKITWLGLTTSSAVSSCTLFLAGGVLPCNAAFLEIAKALQLAGIYSQEDVDFERAEVEASRAILGPIGNQAILTILVSSLVLGASLSSLKKLSTGAPLKEVFAETPLFLGRVVALFIPERTALAAKALAARLFKQKQE